MCYIFNQYNDFVNCTHTTDETDNNRTSVKLLLLSVPGGAILLSLIRLETWRTFKFLFPYQLKIG